MNTITVDKKQLLDIVKKNRTEHRAIFEEAFANYRKLCQEKVESLLDEIKTGKRFTLHIQLPAPSDQTKEYDRVIRMLEMDKNSEVNLEERDFAAYVMNDWPWMQASLVSNSRYSATATRVLSTLRTD